MATAFATAQAEGFALQNQSKEALRLIDDAIAQVGDHGESFDMPEMLRVKGDILARSGHLAEAEGYLQKSLGLSRRQCALGWELRGAITLGRLWRNNGRAGETRALIQPLLARYLEGLTTRDLVSAKDLLNVLN